MTTSRTRRKALQLVGACAAATLTLTACGNAGSPGSAGKDGTAQLTSIGGQRIALPADREPTAVFFFTSGCGECVGGTQSLGEAAAAAKKSGTRAHFLAVDMDPGESKDTINAFMDYVHAEQVPTVIDTGATLTQRYHIAALSTLIVIDADGKVTYRGTDPSAQTITAALKKAGA
jgi:hypothetical protein